MKRVLYVGQKPETVDFSDPGLPPGMDAAKVSAGIATAMRLMKERGWAADECMISPDASGRAALEQQLRAHAYDCVAIGGGLRVPPRSLQLFEGVLNLVHRYAPAAAIAFNTRPEDTADAVARWL